MMWNTSLQGSGRIKEGAESEKPLPIPAQTRAGQGCFPALEKALGLNMDMFRVNNKKLVKIFIKRNSPKVFNHWKMETDKALIQDAAFCL